jgi:L-lactate utilization protein LutB
MTKSKGTKWDGKSRVSNDFYRKNFNEIFKKVEDPFKKQYDELNESYEQSKRAKKEREKLLKKLDERNGF